MLILAGLECKNGRLLTSVDMNLVPGLGNAHYSKLLFKKINHFFSVVKTRD